MTEPLRKVSPGFSSDIGVKKLYTDTAYELPWLNEKYLIHMDHFAGKNGVHENQQTRILNNYWTVDAQHSSTSGLAGLRPTDGGTVVRLNSGIGTPAFIWSFLNQYRYGTLIRWKSRQYYCDKPTEVDEACFHGLIDVEQEVGPVDPFNPLNDVIGFKYEHSDGDLLWHILLRNGVNVMDVPTTVAIELNTWYTFKIIKSSNGNLYFYINDMRNPVLAVYYDDSSDYITTGWLSELHWINGAQETVKLYIDYSMIKCLNEPLTPLCV